MAKQGRDPDGLARFGEPGVLVLLALSGGPKHGYVITADVAERTGITLGPGTLYGSLAKLEKLGLITALPSEDRRRPYEITAAGREALVAQLQRWSLVVETGKARLAWT
jgi:DNA-binding PadR family transcriptional regulator